jgi:hypothetical protein
VLTPYVKQRTLRYHRYPVNYELIYCCAVTIRTTGISSERYTIISLGTTIILRVRTGSILSCTIWRAVIPALATRELQFCVQFIYERIVRDTLNVLLNFFCLDFAGCYCHIRL